MAAAVWVIVGVPVAAVIAAFRVSVYVITSFPEMAVTAAVLGAVHGLWLYLAGRPSESESRERRWLGWVSGGVLGFLGFPPVFSRSNIVADRPMMAFFLVAAICGGIAAGLASGRLVAVPVRDGRSTVGRTVTIGCLIVLPLAALDYHFYWPPTSDRLPVARVSRQDLSNLSAGDARGSAWAGCYEYLGQFSRGSGVIGEKGGLLKVEQADGALKVLDGSAHPLLGGVDGNGHFRFGGATLSGQDTMRVLWEGKFHGSSLEFTERVTVSRDAEVQNTTRVTGTAQRIACD
jgi:hypothetical protein